MNTNQKNKLNFPEYEQSRQSDKFYILNINYKDCIALPFNPFYTNKNYNYLRRLKLSNFSSALNKNKKYKGMKYDEKINIINKIELSCLNETIRKSKENNIRCTWENTQFNKIYHGICYKVLSYIDISNSEGSEKFVEMILNKKVDIKKVATMSSNEICPEKYIEIKEKIELRNNTKQKIKYTELYFCRKCKKNQTTAQRVQNRSNDEGSSFYITCLYCGNKWFGG